MAATDTGDLSPFSESEKEHFHYIIERDQRKNVRYTSLVARMRPKIKKQWTGDLRRNPKNQGYGRLHLVPDTERDSKGHFRRSKQCCLGRLCMLASDEVSKPHKVKSPFAGYYAIEYGTALTPHYLPQEVRDWAWDDRLSVNDNPILFSMPNRQGKDPLVYTLAEVNDAGFTYAQIADLIDYFL